MPDDLDAIALRVHQIAAMVGMLAEGQERGSEAMSHTLYLIEECLLDVEARVEGLQAVGEDRPRISAVARRPGR